MTSSQYGRLYQHFNELALWRAGDKLLARRVVDAARDLDQKMQALEDASASFSMIYVAIQTGHLMKLRDEHRERSGVRRRPGNGRRQSPLGDAAN